MEIVTDQPGSTTNPSLRSQSPEFWFMSPATSLITQSTQHYKGTHPTPALCPISILRSGLSTATRYTLHATRYTLHATRYTLHATRCSETYLLFLLLMGSCVFLVCLPRLSPLICQRAAIDLGCVPLLVIHEFLARQVPSVYPLLSRQTTKSHTHNFSLLPQLLNQ